MGRLKEALITDTNHQSIMRDLENNIKKKKDGQSKTRRTLQKVQAN